MPGGFHRNNRSQVSPEKIYPLPPFLNSALRMCKTLCMYAYLLMWQFRGGGGGPTARCGTSRAVVLPCVRCGTVAIFFEALRALRLHPLRCYPVWNIPPILLDNA